MKKIKVAFFDAKPYDKESFNNENSNFGYDIKYFRNRLNIDTAPLSEGYDVVCAFVNDTISKEVIDILVVNKVKVLALRCAGYNNVDLKEAYGKLHIARVPQYSPYAVAEHAVALIMALNRKTHKAYSRVRDNNFTISGFLGFDMHGKTAGVIGTGRIGRILIKILHGFGMNIKAFDHYPDKEFAKKYNVDFVDIDTLYKDSDIISLNCPLNAETHHLINNESIAKMKDGVMIINTGRGQLIDTKALIEGLKSKKIDSAGLDVYEEENEYFFEDFSETIINDDVLARLLTFNNVLVTSHQAFFTKEALRNIARTTLGNIDEFYLKGKLENEICYQCDKECKKKKDGICF